MRIRVLFSVYLSIRRAAMAFMGRRVGNYICSELYGSVMNQRLYSSRVDWKQLRPMILKRIKNRAKDYPIKRMIPVAEEVVRAREIVTEGVSMLLKVVPVHSCKFCPEVHIGAVGHQMKTCHGFKRMIKDQPHKWDPGCLNGILVPVESFHLENMFQDEIKHDQRFDYTRVPAVLELCHQAGAEIPDGVLHRSDKELSATVKGTNQKLAPLLPDELRLIGQRTMEAWERLRLGVTKLLLVYPSKVCQHCSEVHVGPSGHKARMCGVFKFEGWRGAHKWKKAGVDDLVPPNIVWHQRPHDPPVLVDSGRDYYGHVPAVIALCMQVGARAPPKYHCMMKAHGLAPPIQQDQLSFELEQEQAKVSPKPLALERWELGGASSSDDEEEKAAKRAAAARRQSKLKGGAPSKHKHLLSRPARGGETQEEDSLPLGNRKEDKFMPGPNFGQLPLSFDPFADAKVEDAAKDYVHLRVQQRNGRKTLTTVQGLSTDYNHAKVLRDLKRELCCNGNVVDDKELGKIIQLQGDHRQHVAGFLAAAGMVNKDNIKVHGF